MQITREDLNPCTVKLTVVCEGDLVRDGFERAYRDLAKKVRVPGFRPGQAPRSVIEKMLAKEDIYDAAAEHIVRKAFREAMEDQGLQPHSQPSVDVKLLDEETSSCEFTVKVPLQPQIELADYKGLAAEKPVADVTEAEVDRQLEDLRRRRSTRESITDRGVIEGDVAVVSIKIEEEAGQGRNFMVVAGQTFPELDSALMGMKVEEMKSVDLPFPKNFQEKDWSGRMLASQITLRSLSAVKLPELDAAFAKLYQTDSVDELRTLIRDGIAGAKEAMAEEYVNEQLLDELLRQSTVHVPDTMWEQVAQRRLEDLAQEQRKKERTLEEYAADKGMTVEQLVEALRQEAESHVKRAVMVQEIFRRENLQLDNQDMNRELNQMAREFGIDAQDLLAQLKKNNAMDELQFRAINHKVSEFLRDSANLTEVKVEA